jgi:hypothetical protein
MREKPKADKPVLVVPERTQKQTSVMKTQLPPDEFVVPAGKANP